MPGYNSQTGHGPHAFQLYVLFVCKCVLYYCQRVSTQLQLTNISNKNIYTYIKHKIITHKNCALLGYYTASSRKSSPMFRNNLSVPSSRVKSAFLRGGSLNSCTSTHKLHLRTDWVSHCDKNQEDNRGRSYILWFVRPSTNLLFHLHYVLNVGAIYQTTARIIPEIHLEASPSSPS
jgi:hypothetical protein